MGVPLASVLARMDNDHVDFDEGMLFNEEAHRGLAADDSQESEVDDHAEASTDSDELDMDHDDRGMAIAGTSPRCCNPARPGPTSLI